MGLQLFLNTEDVHSAKNIPTRVPGDGFARGCVSKYESRGLKVHECQHRSEQVVHRRRRHVLLLDQGSFGRAARHRMLLVLAGSIRTVSVLATGIRGIAIALGAVYPTGLPVLALHRRGHRRLRASQQTCKHPQPQRKRCRRHRSQAERFHTDCRLTVFQRKRFPRPDTGIRAWSTARKFRRGWIKGQRELQDRGLESEPGTLYVKIRTAR